MSSVFESPLASGASSPNNSISEIERSITTSSIAGASKKQKQKTNYNSPNYELEPDSESSIYIFKNGLFTRTLLPITLNTARQCIVQCTLYVSSFI